MGNQCILNRGRVSEASPENGGGTKSLSGARLIVKG